MSINFINSERGPTPMAPYSHAVKANGFLYLSGFCGIDINGNLVGDGDIRTETRQVLENLKNVIEDAGSKFDNIVKVNIFITDISIYADLNLIYAQYFKSNKPARSCVEVKSLPVKNAKVEIEVIVLA